ncbi:MAG: cytochrome c [Chitinophagaceae bacterium]|nr:MAG: cytochrome c [Chitinophagaceae bacterium]
MKLASLVLLLFFAVLSCQNARETHYRVFSTDNIPHQEFIINPLKDNTLRTSHGSVFRIRSGTYAGSMPVTIRIQEVLTDAEILLSGIPTLSNGKLLSSDGMFFYEAGRGTEMLQPQIPVNVSIPNNTIEDGMLLFKGETGKDSLINWVDPVAFDTVPRHQAIAAGKALINGSCGSCHHPFKDGTGPALFNFQNRGPFRNPANALAFINNPAAFMALSQYAQDLKARYGSVMTAFPAYTADDIDVIIAYLSSLKGPQADAILLRDSLAAPMDTSTIVRDCGTDSFYIPSRDTVAMFDTTGSGENIFSGNVSSVDTTDDFDVPGYKYGKYNFEINANGWYNIDKFFKQTDGLPSADLRVTVDDAGDTYLDVSLYIPSFKTLQPLYRKRGVYVGPYDSVRLPLGERCIVMAVGAKDNKTFYAVKETWIRKPEDIHLELKETTPEKLKNVMSTYRIDGVEIRAVENVLIREKVPCSSVLTAADTTTKVPK